MASSAIAVTTPSNYSKPIAHVDSEDRSAWIIITVAFCLVVTTSCLATRIFVRLKPTSTLGYDDAFFVGAFVFAVIESAMALQEVRMGFGETIKDIEDSYLEPAQKYAYVAVLFFVLTIYSAKGSVLVLFKRLSDQLFSRPIWTGLGVAFMLCGIASIFLVALTCDLTEPWLQYEQHCPTFPKQWQVVTVLDIATEVVLVGVAVYLVWALQITIAIKIKVVCAFAARLALIAIASFHLHYITEQITSSDPTLIGATALVIRQVEVSFALLSALIPCLRPFLIELSTDFMAMGRNTIVHGASLASMSSSRNRNAIQNSQHNYHLEDIDKRSKGSALSARMQGSRRLTNVSRANLHTIPDDHSIVSHGSQQQIIRKTTRWEVESESRQSI